MIRIEVRRLPNGVVTARGTHTWWTAPQSRSRELFLVELPLDQASTPEDAVRELAALLAGPSSPLATGR